MEHIVRSTLLGSSQRRKLSILNIKLTKAIEEYFNNKNEEPFPDRRKIIISRNGYCIDI